MVKNKEICYGCFACVNSCPQKCIEMKMDVDGFFYPIVDELRCINCGVCDNKCVSNSSIYKKTEIANAYAAYSRTDSIIRNSSSGGIFSELADYILRQGGTVFGASFDSEWNVVHISISSFSEIGKLQGSKYIQSDMKMVYEQVKTLLNEGKKILFVSTPCQIAGLSSYLSKKYENLYLIDLVCHGVSSQKFWSMYLSEFKKRGINSISFRNKDFGWKNYNIKIKFCDGKVYQSTPEEDYFMKAFTGNLNLRPSCYKCKFKGSYRDSDLTLADFWGVEKLNLKIANGNGTSLVIVNSMKGMHLLNDIRMNVELEEVSIDEAIKYNDAYVQPTIEPVNREEFMDYVRTGSYSKLKHKYLHDSVRVRLYRLKKKLQR